MSLLTPESLAERWQCSPALVRKMLNDGRLSARISGGVTIIDSNDVEEIEAGKRSTAPPPNPTSIQRLLKGGYVYFIKAGEHIKIGFTTKPDMRLKGLATGSAVLMEVLAMIPAKQVEERRAHAAVSAHRVRGEWFHDCEDVRALMAKMLGRP
jgi:hypothetical protein